MNNDNSATPKFFWYVSRGKNEIKVSVTCLGGFGRQSFRRFFAIPIRLRLGFVVGWGWGCWDSVAVVVVVVVDSRIFAIFLQQISVFVEIDSQGFGDSFPFHFLSCFRRYFIWNKLLLLLLTLEGLIFPSLRLTTSQKTPFTTLLTTKNLLITLSFTVGLLSLRYFRLLWRKLSPNNQLVVVILLLILNFSTFAQVTITKNNDKCQVKWM